MRIKHEIQSGEGRVPEEGGQQAAGEALRPLLAVDGPHCLAHATVAVHPALEGGGRGLYRRRELIYESASNKQRSNLPVILKDNTIRALNM